jgi:hypothetical protein
LVVEGHFLVSAIFGFDQNQIDSVFNKRIVDKLIEAVDRFPIDGKNHISLSESGAIFIAIFKNETDDRPSETRYVGDAGKWVVDLDTVDALIGLESNFASEPVDGNGAVV